LYREAGVSFPVRRERARLLFLPCNIRDNPIERGPPGQEKTGNTDDILGRLNTAAKHNKGIDTALRNAATLAGGSRSEGALGLGTALKRAGWSFGDMKGALLSYQATGDWSCDADERQFERIWTRSNNDNGETPDADSSPAPPKPWQPPKTWQGLDSALLSRILDDIEAGFPDSGSRYSSGNAATDRAIDGAG
jgi:hypothetical protein